MPKRCKPPVLKPDHVDRRLWGSAVKRIEALLKRLTYTRAGNSFKMKTLQKNDLTIAVTSTAIRVTWAHRSGLTEGFEKLKWPLNLDGISQSLSIIKQFLTY